MKNYQKETSKGLCSYISDQIKYAFNWVCNHSSLHGLHYMSSTSSSKPTRLFFAFVNCCSLALCIFLIQLVLYEYQAQSVISTIKSTAYPVWKLRFPAVTLCNFNVVYRKHIKKVKNIVRINKINEDVFNDMLYNLSSLITYDNLGDMTGYQAVFDGLTRVGYTVDRLMADLAHPCNNMIKRCFWQSEEVACSRIFETVKTSDGYCCAFNYYGTMDTEDNIKDPFKSLFQHVGGAGQNLGLRLLLDVEDSQYVSSVKPSYGINVLVQDGLDYPDMDLTANTLLPAEELTVSVYPKLYVSSESVRYLAYDHRHCLFEDEGGLEWTATYSYRTCISQCRVEAIYHFCNCVPYYYPIERPVRICTLLDVPCLQINKYKYYALEIIDSFFAPKDPKKMIYRGNSTAVQCKCYPQCNEQMFNFHTDRAKATQMEGFTKSNISTLNVYYNTIGAIKTERDVYFTWDRVVASIGGIFGLCLGGSIISVLECFYFFVKAMFSCKKRQPPSKFVKPVETHPNHFQIYRIQKVDPPTRLIQPYQPQLYLNDFKMYHNAADFGRKYHHF